MSYLIYQSDGTPITIPDNAIDQQFYNPLGGSSENGLGVQFIGRNTTNYGSAIAQNFLQLAENFASNVVPADSTSLQGQLWFNVANTTSGALHVRKATTGTAGGLSNWYQVITDDGTGSGQVAGNVTIGGTMTAGAFSGSVSGNAATATSLAGGAANQVPYQTASSTTAFIAAPVTANSILQWNGSNIVWNTLSSGEVTTALGYIPVNKSGDTNVGSFTMATGANITLNGGAVTGLSSPVNPTDAADKSYVDSVASGLVWQASISAADILNDSLNTPPASPAVGQGYIVNSTPTGAWAGLAGHMLQWTGSAWQDLFGRVIQPGDRFAIGIEHGGTPAGGSFAGKENNLVQVAGGSVGAWTYTFTAPGTSYAVNVSNSNNTVDGGDSYTYSTSLSQWVQFSAATNYSAGTGIAISGTHIISNTGVLAVTNGGNVTIGGTSTNPTVAITGANVNAALGYTPYNSSNPAGYVTAATSPTASSFWSLDNASATLRPGNIINYQNHYILQNCTYNGTSGALTISVAGWYFITASYSSAGANFETATITIKINGGNYASNTIYNGSNDLSRSNPSVTFIVYLNVGQYVQIYTTANLAAGLGSFTGFKIA